MLSLQQSHVLTKRCRLATALHCPVLITYSMRERIYFAHVCIDPEQQVVSFPVCTLEHLRDFSACKDVYQYSAREGLASHWSDFKSPATQD